MSPERTGLLILRAWPEAPNSGLRRVHFHVSSDVASGFERDTVFTNADVICGALHDWLDAFVEEETRRRWKNQ